MEVSLSPQDTKFVVWSGIYVADLVEIIVVTDRMLMVRDSDGKALEC